MPIGRVGMDGGMVTDTPELGMWRPSATYLLGPFRFGIDQVAPLTSPYTEAGAVGSLTLTDTGNKWSISGGELVGGGTTAANNPVAVSPASFARLAGRALLWKHRPTANGRYFVRWSGTANGVTQTQAFDIAAAGAGRVYDNAGAITGVYNDASVGTQYDVAMVLRASGAFSLLNIAGAGWKLVWVGAAGTTTPLYPSLDGSITASSTAAIDNFRVADLGGLWATDYGIATDRKATSANADTIAQAVDALVEHTITAATGVTQELMVRRTDDNNCCIVRMDQAGSTIKVIDKVAGVETQKSSTAQTWTNGTPYRVVVVVEGAAVTPFVANTAKTAGTLVGNLSATGVKVSHAGVDLVAWPRTPALPGAI